MSRRGKEASIRLDDGGTSEGRSLGPLSELNLDIPLFIGGLRYKKTLEVAGNGTLPKCLPHSQTKFDVAARRPKTGQLARSCSASYRQRRSLREVDGKRYRAAERGRLQRPSVWSYASYTPFVVADLSRQRQRFIVAMPKWRRVPATLSEFCLQVPDGFSWKTLRKTYVRLELAFPNHLGLTRIEFPGTDEAEITRPIRFDGKTFLKYPNQLKDV